MHLQQFLFVIVILSDVDFLAWEFSDCVLCLSDLVHKRALGGYWVATSIVIQHKTFTSTLKYLLKFKMFTSY